MSKTVIFHITTHPIEPELLKKLGIYSTTRVTNARIGSVTARLVKAGFNNIDVDASVSPFNYEINVVTYHLTRTKDQNGVYLK